MLRDARKSEPQTQESTCQCQLCREQTVSVWLDLGMEHDRIGMMLEFLDNPSDFFKNFELGVNSGYDGASIEFVIVRADLHETKLWLTVTFSGFEPKDLREHVIAAAKDPATYFGMCTFKGSDVEPNRPVWVRFDPPVEAIR